MEEGVQCRQASLTQASVSSGLHRGILHWQVVVMVVVLYEYDQMPSRARLAHLYGVMQCCTMGIYHQALDLTACPL